MLLLTESASEVLQAFATNLQVEALRYILFAGGFFVVFYIIGWRFFYRLKIQQKSARKKQIIREASYSASSLLIFSFIGMIMYLLIKHGYTQFYSNFSDHSVGYFIFSTIAFIVIHDTYFYFTHRLMHHKKIFPIVHKVHHLSTDPTPWAAYAFHPFEAVVQGMIGPIMFFLIPLHPLAIIIFGLFQITLNIMGHLGFEIFHSGFTTGLVSKWANTSTHHNMHHRFVKCNYGLYFNFWDRILGTNHINYTQEFEQVKSRAKSSEMEKEMIPQALMS